MKAKRLVVILITFILLLCFSFNCSADRPTIEKNENYKQNKYFSDAEKCDESHIYVTSDEEILLSCYLYNVVCDKSVYTRLKQGENFDDCFLEKVDWVIFTDKAVTVVNDAIIWYSYEDSTDYKESFLYVDFDCVDAAVKSLGTTMDDENLVVKLADNYGFFAIRSIVYIRYNNEQYFMFFGVQEFMSEYGFEDRKMYSLDEFLKGYESYINDYGKMVVPRKKTLMNIIYDNLTVIIVSVVLVALIIASVTVYIIKKKKAKNR